MDKFFARFASVAYTLMRFFFGFLFAFHGTQKLFGMFGGNMAGSTLMWVAGIVEFFGGLAIALGFLTPYMAFLAAGQMAVAYFSAHAPRDPWPILNGGELALLYLFGFLYIMTHSSGRLSVDALIGRKV
ncbi:MAG: DoxX family protein [Acidobacteriota bacterium]